MEGSLQLDGECGDVEEGEIFSSVIPSSVGNYYEACWFQIIPQGFYIPDSKNIPGQYGIEFLPPRYCIEDEWKIWSCLSKDPFPSCSPDSLVSGDFSDSKIELTLRNAYFAEVQQHYYKKPPIIERGQGQFLYDRYGRAYLDMVNNVAGIFLPFF